MEVSMEINRKHVYEFYIEIAVYVKSYKYGGCAKLLGYVYQASDC